MASIINDPNGRKRIEFNGIDGNRYGVRLGKASTRDVIGFKSRIEYLTSVRLRGDSPDAETCKWIANLPAKVRAKLSRAGLVDATAVPTLLFSLIDEYIAGRTDAKPRTIINLQTSRDYLAKKFDAATVLTAVTPADAEDFYRYLIRAKPDGPGLSMNTARRICGRAKQFFALAIRKRLLADNPFAGIKCRVQASSDDRKYFITRAEAEKVLAACPDDEWRLIFALSRFGGLRCPSEHLALRWEDIDWQTNRFTVRSPKTEHHEGKAFRIVPIFPELRPYFEALRPVNAAGPVITIRRDRMTNLRSGMHRIIERAGLKPWPKTFHNLRASRQTELAGQFPIHVVCEWIGNSGAIAQKHYLTVTDSHLEKAIGKSDVKAARKASGDDGLTRKSQLISSQQEIDNFPIVPPKDKSISHIPENMGTNSTFLVGVFSACRNSSSSSTCQSEMRRQIHDCMATRISSTLFALSSAHFFKVSHQWPGKN